MSDKISMHHCLLHLYAFILEEGVESKTKDFAHKYLINILILIVYLYNFIIVPTLATFVVNNDE